MQPQGHVEVLVNLIDFGNERAGGGARRRSPANRARRQRDAPPAYRRKRKGGTVSRRGRYPGCGGEGSLSAAGTSSNRVKVNGGGYQGNHDQPANRACCTAAARRRKKTAPPSGTDRASCAVLTAPCLRGRAANRRASRVRARSVFWPSSRTAVLAKRPRKEVVAGQREQLANSVQSKRVGAS